MSPSALLPSTAVVIFLTCTASWAFAPRARTDHGRRRRLSPSGSSVRRTGEDEECLLMPQSNPNSDPNATSLSGVPYSAVTSGIDALYPPRELSSRNARSRTDGYWKYVERGERPPQELTYGEFDIEFFGMLLDRAWEIHSGGLDDATTDTAGGGNLDLPWKGRTFCDIGSGAGRLVLTAAALHPGWRLCRGLEILEGLHDMATSIADGCRSEDGEEGEARALPVPCNESDARHLPLAPIQFARGSFADPYEFLGDVDCAFVFSSCMKPDLVRELSLAVGRQCKPGTIVITTEFPLFLRGTLDPMEGDRSMPHGDYEIQLLEKIDGWCWLLGGESTAYIHRVKTSLWEEYSGPRNMPESTLEDEAFGLVQLMESGELTDTEAFVRKVRNNMIFHGVDAILGIGKE